MSDETPKTSGPKRSAARSLWVLAAASIVLILADVLYHKHTYLAFEAWFGFFGLFGFAASAVLLLAARALRTLLSRSEDYYDR